MGVCVGDTGATVPPAHPSIRTIHTLHFSRLTSERWRFKREVYYRFPPLRTCSLVVGRQSNKFSDKSSSVQPRSPKPSLLPRHVVRAKTAHPARASLSNRPRFFPPIASPPSPATSRTGRSALLHLRLRPCSIRTPLPSVCVSPGFHTTSPAVSSSRPQPSSLLRQSRLRPFIFPSCPLRALLSVYVSSVPPHERPCSPSAFRPSPHHISGRLVFLPTTIVPSPSVSSSRPSLPARCVYSHPHDGFAPLPRSASRSGDVSARQVRASASLRFSLRRRLRTTSASSSPAHLSKIRKRERLAHPHLGPPLKSLQKREADRLAETMMEMASYHDKLNRMASHPRLRTGADSITAKSRYKKELDHRELKEDDFSRSN
ncbi:hypothetical protein ACLOJK_029432 [Asimina triloba]